MMKKCWILAVMMGCVVSLGACIEGVGNGGDTEGVCESGEACTFGCNGGVCDFVCESGSDCNVGCNGGQCNGVCEAGATCDMLCNGGECVFDCEAGSDCDTNCNGGDCTVNDESSPDPNPAPNPEPEPDTLQTCAELCERTGQFNDDEINCAAGFFVSRGYNVISSETCLNIDVEAQCLACRGEFDIKDDDCADAFEACSED